MPSNLANQIGKTLSDAGYIAVGLGVMGVQQVHVRGAALRDRAAQTTTAAGERAQALQSEFSGRSRDARSQARTQVEDAVTRTKELRNAVGARVEPVVGQLQLQLGELPERVVQAMEPITARVREFGGN